MSLLNAPACLLISLLLSVGAFAQPGETCVFDYNPFVIGELGNTYGNFGARAAYSSSMFEKRIKSDHIFVAKIIAKAPLNGFRVEGLSVGGFELSQLQVIREIAGKLNKKNIEIVIKTRCWQTIGAPEIGSEHIFFADQVSTETFTGLFSSKWSASLDGIPKSELGKIAKELRNHRNGIKKPLIVGHLIKHKPNPFFDYVNRSFNEGSGSIWRDPKFKNDWRIKKSGYDPDYAEPLKRVKVTVRNLEGVEIAATLTDSNGRFEFADLPKGNYVISPDVPKSYLVVGKCHLDDEQKGGVGFYVADNKHVCDRAIRLDVAPAGSFTAEIELVQGDWKDSSVYYVYLIRANSKTGEIYYDNILTIPVSRIAGKKLPVLAEKVMTGEYILWLGGDVYYPGVRDIKKAEIFEIKEGATTRRDISILSLEGI